MRLDVVTTMWRIPHSSENIRQWNKLMHAESGRFERVHGASNLHPFVTLGACNPKVPVSPRPLLNRLKYSALNVDITLVGSCICRWDTLKLTSNNYILHCFCIFCAVPHCHPLSPHRERSPSLPDRIWKTTMRFVGKSSYMTWWMIKERGNPGDSPIQTILEMKLVELLNEIIFLAYFNKQSNRVLEKCNNTFFQKHQTTT